MFGPSVMARLALRLVLDLLCPLLTSACASRHLSMPVAQGTHADLPGYCAPTFTLMPVGSTPHRSVQVSGFDDFGHLTPMRRLISASCSSGQRFAIRLPSDSRSPAKPLPSANSSPCRASRGLPPPSRCALPGAPKKKPPGESPGGFHVAREGQTFMALLMASAAPCMFDTRFSRHASNSPL